MAASAQKIIDCGTGAFRSQAILYSGLLVEAYQAANAQVVVSDLRAAVERNNSDGSVEAHTSNGHIRVEGLRGALDATTSNSSIHARIEHVIDSVRVQSSNGSIDLTLPPGANVPVRAHTSNSSITLHMPGDVNARLTADTSNSSITSDFELRMRGEFNKHHLEGTIGNGGPAIELSTRNGGIHHGLWRTER